MRYFLILILVMISVGCANTRDSEKTKYLLLNYNDFGPQVIAHEIIGMNWLQWNSHGGSRPIKYTIKIVVYTDIELSNVSRKFPVDESEGADYRYLKFNDAVRYLDDKIGEDVIPSVTERLMKTRKIVIDAFK